MKAALSAKVIENAKPEAKRYAIPDVGHPGLRVLVYPSGAKSFTYRFKRDNGQDMTVVLGPASGPGAITLVQARDAAREARRQRSQGADPADQKRAARKAEMASASRILLASAALSFSGLPRTGASRRITRCVD
jgi:hypothetical protein